MIRYLLLTSFAVWLSCYAWKDWYKALCGLILLMAFTEHPDMPKQMGGIPGLNAFNLVLLSVLASWVVNRSKDKLTWDMPAHINVLLLIYLLVIFVSYLRMIWDTGQIVTFYMVRNFKIPSTFDLTIDYLINSIKFVIPGLLLFDGCRNEKRLKWGLFSIVALYFVIALLVIKTMGFGTLSESGEYLRNRSLKLLRHNVGYHRVDLSMMLAGASWAVFSLIVLVKGKGLKMLVILAAFIVFLGQAMTGGRTGYATWAFVGLILCVFRWHKLAIVSPLVVLALFAVMPAAFERLTEGFGDSSSTFAEDSATDVNAVMAGRDIAWPLAIETIKERPWVGYGSNAMIRTGLSLFIWTEHNDTFPHPHNAYLEFILNNGLVGSVPVFFFYFIVLWKSLLVFKQSANPLLIAVGGVACSLVCAQLSASIGAQTFYPREGTVGMWCAIGLLLRVYVEKSKESLEA